MRLHGAAGNAISLRFGGADEPKTAREGEVFDFEKTTVILFYQGSKGGDRGVTKVKLVASDWWKVAPAGTWDKVRILVCVLHTW